MDKVTMVYGHAYNEVYVPITAFLSFDTAVCEITTLTGKTPRMIKTKQALFPEGLRRAEWDIDFEAPDDPEEKIIWDKFFSSYYGGCGDCSSIIAREIESGKMKLFPFDMD